MNGEEKSERFIRLANSRVNRALRDLRLIKNLANKQNYKFTEAQSEKIIKALSAEMQDLKNSFYKKSVDNNQTFKL